MNVVLDSNILCADYRMEGNAFRVFLAALPRVGVTVYIPQIVIDEVINRYSEDLGKVVSSHERLLRTWHQLTGREVQITEQPWHIPNEVTAYKEDLTTRLKSVGGKTLPYPHTPHEILIRRALERRRPFQDKGGGYRDALIWEAVLSLCKKEGSTTLLITKNRRDFGDGPQPHFDLLRDLRDAGLTEEALRVIKSLEDFNNEFLVPQLERLDEMIRRFSQDEVPAFSLNRWVELKLKEVLRDQEWAATLVGIQESHSRAFVGSCQQSKSVEVDDVRLLPTGDLLLAATAYLTMEIGVDGDPGAYYRYEDVRALWGDDPPTEDSTAWFPLSARVAFSLVLKKDTLEVLSEEIDEVDGDYTVVQANPHPRRPS